ncbi:FKBP-type peptidyl-prolyl cis-trans isomerase [Cytophaga hutchinsonii]|uniref:Peptidyl-prolyl cis-trans isomerase n=1 Tax=Cytophaga hutchinsonii (strain ATCC 33406 / DSM 1761 / CIP 103989 / NBRC 15051 / NCIMB 9469 / D465) TaxID=269798 RepID=A0A6N4SX87_CYTH3|nr:FKBP-type peptidyl-prolyl cis-trans isomerase [Cytophaga hutchinsonii]ABG60884.1 FKBP-type peptidyl-prolyl cis-trans isomerase (rotamase) [Cytophaga hutchinsonii ATCC 33406]SFX99706.1 FKBP-type peptidyl-prolyl cis-trans isomerase [Cytophaga hutchinsonii ATCC 33406]
MNRISIFLFLFCACILNVYAQNKKTPATGKAEPSYLKTASGLEYKIIKEGPGNQRPEQGGYISFWFQLQTLQDSIIDSQFGDPNPVGIPTQEALHKPGIEEGFLLLTEGDSAVFLLNADSLYINSFHQKRPDYLKPQSKVKMIVKMGTVYSKQFVDSVMAQQKIAMAEQSKGETDVYTKDSIAIQNYLKQNHLSGVATPGGAYVVILEKSTFSKADLKAGEDVQTTYIGSLLSNGSVFDKSAPGDYFKFRLGSGQVIQGWDQGFLKLKHGDKALILIPSRLAYGTRGAGGSIPPNAPLVFEVQVK